LEVNFEKLINYALRSGADEAEIFYVNKISKMVKSEGENIHPKASVSTDISIRVSIGKKVGSVFTTTMDEDLLRDEVHRAISIARVSEEDKYWNGMPDPEKPIHKHSSFSEEIASLAIDRLISDLDRLVDYARRIDRDIKPFESYLATTIYTKKVYNSRGMNIDDKGSSMEFVIMMKGKDAGREVSIYDYDADTKPLTRREELIEDLARRVKALYKAKKLESPLKVPIIFKPKPFSELLYFSFIRAIHANNVQEGRSPLKNKIDTIIADKGLDIIDDGTIPWALGTSIYDDEGIPRRKTYIISGGKLKGFIHNTYTARREGVSSTGNASRHGMMVTIAHSNILLQGKSRELDKLISGIDRGIFADGSLLNIHSSNYVTGEINGVIYEAYTIENGTISDPLMPVALSGSIYDAFKNISLGKNAVQTAYRFILPPVLVDGLTVA